MASLDEMFGLKGRLALVTGASRGIGQALAVGLARAGADLVVTARSLSGLADTKENVRGLGRSCTALEVDVRSLESIAALFETLADWGLSPDILVNNAGTEEVRPSLEVDEALWDKIVDTNQKGAFFVAQGFAKSLIAAERAGQIVNLCSLTSVVGVPTAAPYTTSKSGLLGMTRALSAEWAPQRIRVNAIGPGYFRTELTEVFYQDGDWASAMLGKIPQGRFGELEDLVGAAVFLCSPAAAYVTGQILFVDGGYTASI